MLLNGELSPQADPIISSYSSQQMKGVAVSVNASLSNAWGFPPSPLKLDIHVTSDCPGVQLAFLSNRNYSLSLTLGPGDALHCSLLFTLNNFASNQTFSDTTAAIDAWLADLTIPPSFARGPITKMYYQSWFNFWYNTEHPEGFWPSSVITPSKSTYGR